MLGTPKAVAALLSGEMKDTAQLNAFAVYGLERFFSKRERASILRSFPGLASMLPKGQLYSNCFNMQAAIYYGEI
jgi:phospholipid:diacylglycerol acyltransferase